MNTERDSRTFKARHDRHGYGPRISLQNISCMPNPRLTTIIYQQEKQLKRKELLNAWPEPILDVREIHAVTNPS